MKKEELKKVLKPLIKECIKEVIFEEGVLSGLITEVVQGLGSVPPQPKQAVFTPQSNYQQSEKVLEAKNQLNEVKNQLQKASGLEGIFEGIAPLTQKSQGKNSQYGALRDKNPSDAGVNIDKLIQMTGGWSHLTPKNGS